jgi:HlyD family secretion protein
MGPRQIRWIVLGAIGVLLALLIGWLFLPRPVEVDVAVASRGPISETLEDQGTTRVRDAYVVASPVSGQLQRINLDVGDRVAAGEAIGTILPMEAELLDPRTRTQAQASGNAAAAAVDIASAEQARWQAEVRRAEASLGRMRALAAKDFVSRQALDDAEATEREARASLRAAQAVTVARRADLARARTMLADRLPEQSRPISVHAPAAGYVTRVMQESARSISAGSPLLEIGDSDGLEAAVEFLSQDAVRIREGMRAEIFDWGGSAPISARVRRIEPQGFTKVSALGVDEQRVLVLLSSQAIPRPGHPWAPAIEYGAECSFARRPMCSQFPWAPSSAPTADGRHSVSRTIALNSRLCRSVPSPTTRRRW